MNECIEAGAHSHTQGCLMWRCCAASVCHHHGMVKATHCWVLLFQGVTAVSKLVPYPPDPDSPSGLPLWVAHWAHPLELEWVAKAAPPPRAWPLLLMQVCSYDTWDR